MTAVSHLVCGVPGQDLDVHRLCHLMWWAFGLEAAHAMLGAQHMQSVRQASHQMTRQRMVALSSPDQRAHS